MCFLGLLARVGAIATPDFAVDDGHPQSLFSQMIGGGNACVHQEHEPFARVPVQVLGQYIVGLFGPGPATQLGQALAVVFMSAEQLLLGSDFRPEFITHVQGVLK